MDNQRLTRQWDIGTDGTPLSHVAYSVTLNSIAKRVAKLHPDPRDPERFHLDKHCIASDLNKLAREAKHG